MSTKIYDAYKYSGSVDLLLKQLAKMKESYNDIVVERLLASEECPDEYLDIKNKINQEIAAGTWNVFNISASVVLYPQMDMKVVQFFGLDRPLHSKLIKPIQRYLKDWHYQDQSDEPEDVSKQEWKQREKYWDRVFKQHDIPSYAGFSFQLDDISKVLMNIMSRKRQANKENKIAA